LADFAHQSTEIGKPVRLNIRLSPKFIGMAGDQHNRCVVQRDGLAKGVLVLPGREARTPALKRPAGSAF
jgi:hypothetical protein